MDTVAEFAPVLGETETVVAVAAGGRRVGPVGAIGDGLQRPAVDAELDPLRRAGPASDQPHPALHECPRRGGF